MIDTPEPRYWPTRTFAVGDRVRIRISAECCRVWPLGSWAMRLGVIGHPPEHDGLTGEVVDVSQGDDHPYLVDIDQPTTFASDHDVTRRILRYAAVELEPLEDQCPVP